MPGAKAAGVIEIARGILIDNYDSEIIVVQQLAEEKSPTLKISSYWGNIIRIKL